MQFLPAVINAFLFWLSWWWRVILRVNSCFIYTTGQILSCLINLKVCFNEHVLGRMTTTENWGISVIIGGLTVCMDWNGAALTLMPLLWGLLETGWKTVVWAAGGRAVEGGGWSDDKDMAVCRTGGKWFISIKMEILSNNIQASQTDHCLLIADNICTGVLVDKKCNR